MNSTRQKIALYATIIIGFAGTTNTMYRPAINRLSAPLITSARSIRGAGYMPKSCNINQQRSFNMPSFGNRQFNQSSGRSAAWAAGLAGAGLGLGTRYYLAQDKPVLAEEQKSIFSTKEGPVNPIAIYREPIIEKPINQPDDYVLSQFIPKASAGRTRLLNHTYSTGQMVIDDTGDEYHVFIKNPYHFFLISLPDDNDKNEIKFYVEPDGSGISISGAKGAMLYGDTGSIKFPEPLAKEILSTSEKPIYITPMTYEDGTIELILKKDMSPHQENFFNHLKNSIFGRKKTCASYYAPQRPWRKPGKPISGPWWAL